MTGVVLVLGQELQELAQVACLGPVLVPVPVLAQHLALG
jgi:hypothetical protein